MQIACLDFEGVLVPEIWIKLAELTGIEELRLTTRDIVDYDELMGHRLKVLSENRIGFSKLRESAELLEPLDGAKDFISWLSSHYQVAIISDTFYELCGSLTQKLGRPMMLCHKLQIKGDEIVGYALRQKDPKKKVVAAFQSINYEVVAAGDSFNDISMLRQANKGTLFLPSDSVIEKNPDLPVALSYDELKKFFLACLA